MGWLLTMVGAAAPGLALVVFWILRPERVELAFDTFLLGDHDPEERAGRPLGPR